MVTATLAEEYKLAKFPWSILVTYLRINHVDAECWQVFLGAQISRAMCMSPYGVAPI